MILKKYQNKLFCCAIAIFLCCVSLAHLYSASQAALFILVISAPLLWDDSKTISFYFFAACFMACFGPSGFLTALNISMLLLATKKIILAIKSKNDLKNIKIITIVWASLLIVLTLYSLLYNKFKVFRMGMFLDFVQCCLIFYLVHKSLNLKYVAFTLLIGLASTVSISALFQLAEIYNPFDAGLLGQRFGGFFNNVNALSVYCSVCASCFIMLILNNQLEFKKYFFCPILATAIGLLPMSKIFMLITVLLYSTWFITSFIKSNHKKRYILYSIIIAVVLAILAIVLQDYIRTLIQRFTNNGHSSAMDNLTTGRTTIWKEYLSRWLKSPITFLFGNGYTAQKIASKHYEHSIYIAFLFQFGVVGSALILGTLIWTLRKAGLAKTPANYILITLLLINGAVSNLSGVLCSCLIWMIAFCFMTNKRNLNSDKINNSQTSENSISTIGENNDK